MQGIQKRVERKAYRHIVLPLFIASILAFLDRVNVSYAALTKGLAREGGPFGIRVNAITPALTDTEMTAQLAPDKRAAIIKMIPLGRPGQPTDIAKAVCFLASEDSDFITGEIMDVDGGFMRD